MLQKKSYGGMYIGPLLWVMILLGIDLGTKYYFYNLELFQHSYRLEPVMNIGISFSWSVPYRLVIPLSLVALVGFFSLYRYKFFSKLIVLLLISGTVGNLYDRIVYGGVRDFLVLPHMFVFNFADIFLFFGMVLVVYDFMFTQKKNN